MTAEAWWRRVVEQTYLRTKHNTQLEPDEVAQVMPVAFDLLYKDIFGTGRGWVVKENVEYTLSRLKQWRDVGGGPLIGVVSNCDERLHTVLRGWVLIISIITIYYTALIFYEPLVAHQQSSACPVILTWS